jgi:hypothetical protein
MENYRGAERCAPWQEMSHELEVDAMRDYNRHYCRAGAQPSSTDIKTYDVGVFQLAVSGVSSGQIGELFVEYDLDFFDPRTEIPIGQNLPVAHIVSSVAGATAAAPFGTGATIRSGSNIPGIAASGVTLTIPAVGRYLVNSVYTSGTISTGPTLTASTGATAVAAWNNNAGSNSQTTFVSNTNGQVSAVFDITAPNGLVTLGGGGTYTAGNTDLFVAQISSGLTKPHLPDIEDVERLYRMLRASADEKAREDGKPRRPHLPIVVDQSDSDDEKGYVKPAGPQGSAGQAAKSATLPSTASAASAAGSSGATPRPKGKGGATA